LKQSKKLSQLDLKNSRRLGIIPLYENEVSGRSSVVERHVAIVVVVGSTPIARSIFSFRAEKPIPGSHFFDLHH
jgi:hypothetical protein